MFHVKHAILPFIVYLLVILFFISILIYFLGCVLQFSFVDEIDNFGNLQNMLDFKR